MTGKAWENIRLPPRRAPAVAARCDRQHVQYVVGLARNTRLQALVADVEVAMKAAFEETKVKQRRFLELTYGAHT